MTKTKIKWRLGTLPTPDEVALLLEKDVLTKDEAREILFSQETEEDKKVKELEAEIKFLKSLIEKLSVSRSTIVETIRYIEKPYNQYGWWNPYQVYCGTTSSLNTTGVAGSTNAIGNSLNAQSGLAQATSQQNAMFLTSQGGTTAAYSYDSTNGFSKIK